MKNTHFGKWYRDDESLEDCYSQIKDCNYEYGKRLAIKEDKILRISKEPGFIVPNKEIIEVLDQLAKETIETQGETGPYNLPEWFRHETHKKWIPFFKCLLVKYLP